MTKGKVYLVGAGPGYPKLITVYGVECIQSPENKKIIRNLFIGYPDDEALKKIKVPARTSFEEKTVWL